MLARFARPVVFTWHGKRWKATPKQLGATADVDGALDRALAGVGGGRTIPVTITVDPAKVERYVDYLDSLYARSAQVGSVTRVGRKAKLVEPLTARAVQKQRMETIITRTLKSATRPPIELLLTETKPGGPGQLFIVVRLEEQSLTLYKDGAVVLSTPVTTGRPALPTPVGSYDIAWRRSPYTFISPWPRGESVLLPARARDAGRCTSSTTTSSTTRTSRPGPTARAPTTGRTRATAACTSRGRDAGALHDGAGSHAADRRRLLTRNHYSRITSR